MIARLPHDIRGRLRGRPDDLELRRLAWLCVEGGGDPCPAQAMDAAIDMWVSLGSPDPEPVAYCQLCGSDTMAPAEEPGALRCSACDVVYGPTWAHNPAMWFERFPDRRLAGHERDWHLRPVRWDVDGVFPPAPTGR